MSSLFSRRHRFFQYRIALLISLAIIVPFGLLTKFYRGPGQAWLNDSFGSIPYEIFWILLVVFIWPQITKGSAAIAVLITTCILEVLQLWHPPFLQAIRATLPGKLVLGTTFVSWDFFYYFIGCFCGWLWVKVIQHYTGKPKVSGNSK